jgi:nitronate monooxygenase
VAACLAAGAEGVWVGTAFIPCPESLGWDEAKRTVLQAGERDTVHTHLFDRLQSIPWPDPYPGRALRNRYTDRWHGREEAALADPAVLEQYRRAGRDHDVEVAHVYAGQAVGLVDTARPAAEVVRDLMDGAEALLRRRTEDLLG